MDNRGLMSGMFGTTDNELDLRLFPCVCCGYLFPKWRTGVEDPPDSRSICRICGWEDEGFSLKWPLERGSNRINLVEGQANFACGGIAKPRLPAAAKRMLRLPDPGDRQ